MTETPHDVSHDDFVEALLNYVNAALRASGEAADYCQEALRVVDARNHLFASAGIHRTDEEQGIYALRDLCAGHRCPARSLRTRR